MSGHKTDRSHDTYATSAKRVVSSLNRQTLVVTGSEINAGTYGSAIEEVSEIQVPLVVIPHTWWNITATLKNSSFNFHYTVPLGFGTITYDLTATVTDGQYTSVEFAAALQTALRTAAAAYTGGSGIIVAFDAQNNRISILTAGAGQTLRMSTDITTVGFTMEKRALAVMGMVPGRAQTTATNAVPWYSGAVDMQPIKLLLVRDNFGPNLVQTSDGSFNCQFVWPVTTNFGAIGIYSSGNLIKNNIFYECDGNQIKTYRYELFDHLGKPIDLRGAEWVIVPEATEQNRPMTTSHRWPPVPSGGTVSSLPVKRSRTDFESADTDRISYYVTNMH